MSLAQATDPNVVGGWMFFRYLKASRLMTPGDIDVLERQAQTEPLEKLQRFLVEENYLNDYQLNRIAQGKPEGLLLGQYRITGELGRGGFGQVFKGHHALMNRVVAIKVLNPDFCQDPVTRDLFMREVVTTTSLSHPNIAAAYDANEVDGKIFLVMEYVDGESLEEYVKKHGLLSPALACSILAQSALALQHAQECGLVHRDLKPANVMLAKAAGPTPSGDAAALRVKLIDFGLASLRRQGGPVATLPCDAGAIVGTPAFIPPEQITDVHAADTRSDLYSLGCTLYYALSGRMPFEGHNTKMILLQHIQHNVPLIRSHRASIPEGLSSIVHRLMAKLPEDRYQTPAELLDAVNAFAAAADVCVPKPAGTPGVPPPPARALAPAANPDTLDWPDQPTSTRPSASDHTDTHLTLVLARRPEPLRLEPPRPVAKSEPAGVADLEIPPLWDAWCEVVGAYAHGRTPAVTAREYKSLYRDLHAAIRAARAGAAELSPAQLDRVQALFEPWVSLDALAHLDEHVLSELVNNCTRLGLSLGWEEIPSGSAAWLVPVLGGAFVLAAGLVFLR